MKNMGLSRLKLVNPRNLYSGECRKMAVSAYDLVEAAEVFDSFEDAVEDEQILIGTSSIRGRKSRTRLHAAREIAPRIHEYAQTQRVCLVFGSERRGLREEHLALCQYTVSIPADPEFPTLNLAQSVLILAYELFTCTDFELNPDLELASQGQREAMFSHMEETLTNVGFLSQSNPGHIMRSIRRFLGKADLTDRDISILRGIMSQMDWYVREGRQRDPERVRKP